MGGKKKKQPYPSSVSQEAKTQMRNEEPDMQFPEYFDQLTKIYKPQDHPFVHKFDKLEPKKPWQEMEGLTLINPNSTKLHPDQVVRTFSYDQLGIIFDKSTDLDDKVR